MSDVVRDAPTILRKKVEEQLTLAYCGDDDGAKGVAATLISDVGFEPVDAGPE
jgi:predicted dinucleotide-binding enzyme